MVGSRVGRYEVIRELGRGGMAVVYLALDPNINRQVALKVLPRQFTSDPQFLARFRREAEVIATLEHPAIVPVYDFGEHDGQPYIVMRHMPGGSLAEGLGSGPLPLAETARIFDRLAQVLDSAHAKGIVHRDLKPANILFDEWDEPYLSDFGIAKIIEGDATALTVTGGFVGTPGYMSPEQVLGDVELDARSDIYSLGVILFQVMTGQLPYQANTPIALAFKHVNEPIPDVTAANSAMPQESQEIINKALAKNREERYPTAAQLAQAVGALLSTRPHQQPDQTVTERSTFADTAEDDGVEAGPAATVQQERWLKRWEQQAALPAQLKRLPAWSWFIIILAPFALLTWWFALGAADSAQDDLPELSGATTPQSAVAEATPTARPVAELEVSGDGNSTETAGLEIEDNPNLPPPHAQLGDTWTRPKDGMEMVYVPPPEAPFFLESGVAAPHDGYWIDKYEVSNAQYQLCSNTGACALSTFSRDERYNGADFPVVGVSWFDAARYSNWVGGVLPTEGEWEYAAVGDSGMEYPWGDQASCELSNYANCLGGPSVVDSYPKGASWVGALNMAGNVWEWTASMWDEDSENPVLRGGSWGVLRHLARSAYRISSRPDNLNYDNGFRVVMRPLTFQ